MDYQILKGKFLRIKEQIDKNIEEKGINQNLINYEKYLEAIYQKVKKVCSDKQDERYINFNYFPCRAVISLAKNYHYVALRDWLIGFKNFVEYTNHLDNVSRWKKSIDYYRSRLNLILKSRIEIFGNLPLPQFKKIKTAFEEVISTISTNRLSTKIQETLIDAIDSIVSSSTEIYTEEHLLKKDGIIALLEKFQDTNNYIVGVKSRIEFMLLKKELHYYLRKILRERTLDKSKIKEVIEQMRETAGREKNNFRKVNNGEKINFKRFLSEIDMLIAKYYDTLWIKENLIEAVKCLEQIFSEIRNNLNIIQIPSMFQYFVNEFLLLQNYIKLILVADTFKNFAQQKGVYEWQKILSEEIFNKIIAIAQENFKYNIPQNTRERKLLIIEKSIVGKFLEFIIFYLLKEFSTLNETNINLKDMVNKNIRDNEIKSLLNIIFNSNPKEIKWSYKIEDTDIDIFIQEKYAIFIKSGIIGSNDRKTIQKEMEVTKNFKVFYLLDIAKNLSIAQELYEKESNRIKIIDVGKFLNEIYDFAKMVGIDMELSKSSIKSLTGFYSGG